MRKTFAISLTALFLMLGGAAVADAAPAPAPAQLAQDTHMDDDNSDKTGLWGLLGLLGLGGLAGLARRKDTRTAPTTGTHPRQP
ncbi:WGxxGxxG family protein [Nocardia arthritidis]|uniref:WGxxGxxG family protein n=1 Tax=Nocardia arthritidis TaxID=228602 RepID=UPI0007A3BC57|nr:WGxxGxxG family protein [Nocardia arthritidis]